MSHKSKESDNGQENPDADSANSKNCSSSSAFAHPLESATTPPLIPDYEMIRRIGIGSYGEVWLARSITDSYHAIKVIYRNSFEHDRPYKREFEGIQKFEPVSRMHETQLDILHVGRNDEKGYFYYVMELADDAEIDVLSNESLKESRIASEFQKNPNRVPNPDSYKPHTLKQDLYRRLPLHQCINLGLTLATALRHLHEHGLVHRDIKPSNIIFVNRNPKLADIGLVASQDASLSFVGTAGYVPQEGAGTPQADLYSLGKVLYEICMGRDRQEFPKLPKGFDDTTTTNSSELLEFNAILLKACENNPNHRYQSAQELEDELHLLNSGRSVMQKRIRQRRIRVMRKALLGISVVAILVAVIALLSTLNSNEEHLHLARTLEAQGDYTSSILQYSKLLQLSQTDTQLMNFARIGMASVLAKMSIPLNRSLKIGKDFNLRFSPMRDQVITFGNGFEADVYSLNPARHSFSLHHQTPLSTVGFSMDSKGILGTSREGDSLLWESNSGRSISTPFVTTNLKDQINWDFLYRPGLDTNRFTFTLNDSSLRIHSDEGSDGSEDSVVLMPLGSDKIFSDAVMSLDILDWNQNNSNCIIGCIARVVDFNHYTYIGRVKLGQSSSGKSELAISNGRRIQKTGLVLHPDKDYRLVFSVISHDIQLAVFDLSNSATPLQTISMIDTNAVKPGPVGIWINLKGSTTGYDVEVDNFKVNGFRTDIPELRLPDA